MTAAASMARNPATIVIGERASCDGIEPIYGPLADASGKQQVPCSTGLGKQTVIVILGQSNAANFGGGRYWAQSEVANLYDGKCYHAVDPLVGVFGDGGNFAARLGDVRIRRGFSDRIVVAPTAMGTTRIEHWSPPAFFILESSS